ncbi:carbon monoxide dehydrogenase subunit G [Halorubrum trapanicum]|uniref:Carbon monoxide dehydrogenase subunit G n=1 Tax=Halorubrum trapanicum TaxID=29284 RepID=A0A8J7UM74_9EURY|nr:SRPBCC family protein [Halorubrum trapanicum]MBP1900541.1 carbon monoxide dehydrogenase subunit G [Halorubrum trapanicum]
MNSVTLSRTIDAPPETVRDAMDDLGPFVRSSGFDDVSVDGETVRVANDVGLAAIELTLEVVDDPDADLAYEQREGIFEAMRTAYVVTPTGAGSEVTATTEFALDVALVGDLLDATVIERQRRTELSAQFDWLEDRCAGPSTDDG